MDQRCEVFESCTRRAASSSPTPGTSAARTLVSSGFRRSPDPTGLAWSLGRADNDISVDDALAHLSSRVQRRACAGPRRFRRICRCARSRGQWPAAAETGSQGCRSKIPRAIRRRPLFDFQLAVERIQAARRAIDDGRDGRALTGWQKASSSAAPICPRRSARRHAAEQARTVCLRQACALGRTAALVAVAARKPVNVVVGRNHHGPRPARPLRRIDVGGGLARAAWTGFFEAAREIAEHGPFTASRPSGARRRSEPPVYVTCWTAMIAALAGAHRRSLCGHRPGVSRSLIPGRFARAIARVRRARQGRDAQSIRSFKDAGPSTAPRCPRATSSARPPATSDRAWPTRHVSAKCRSRYSRTSAPTPRKSNACVSSARTAPGPATFRTKPTTRLKRLRPKNGALLIEDREMPPLPKAREPSAWNCCDGLSRSTRSWYPVGGRRSDRGNRLLGQDTSARARA